MKNKKQANSQQDVVTLLREAINKELKKIKPSVYPKIHTRIKNRIGYAQIEDTIINMVIANGMTPSACIGLLESEL